MITQKYQHGENEITIESAESIEDSEKNNFRKGEYVRYKINGKKVENYLAMIRFIVNETQKSKTTMIPTGEKIQELRKEMMNRQHEEISKQIEELRKQVNINNGYTDEIKRHMNDFLDKTDPIGVRIKK